MKYFLIVLLGVAGLTPLVCRAMVLTGRVVDAKDRPVPEVKVELENRDALPNQKAGGAVLPNKFAIAETDAKGDFTFADLDTGAYVLNLQNPSGKSLRREVTIGPALDTTHLKIRWVGEVLELSELSVEEKQTRNPKSLRSVEGVSIYEGKKSELIVMEDVTANLAANNSRQIYSRVAGLNTWESDGGGIQLGIATRGLDPKRTAEFNTRLNGYDLSADALGYPESYYTPPAEALDRIEVVRGASSLQYGTQFGGMINFVLHKPPEGKPLEVISRQSMGRFGLLNSFNSLGGDLRKLKYYGYYQHKQGNDWRPNSSFDLNTGYLHLEIPLGKKLSLGIEATHMTYLARQPGGLNDRRFQQDPKESLRERNWFGVDWNLGAVTVDYKPAPTVQVNSKLFGLMAGRDALGILGMTTRADTGGVRDLLKDDYLNFGNETRLLWRTGWRGFPMTLLVGGRAYSGRLHRRQGPGNDGSGPSFEYLNPDDLPDETGGSDYLFPSRNYALFAENIIYLSERWTFTPGLRWEYIHTEADGAFNADVVHPVAGILEERDSTEHREDTRHFPLLGGAISYHHPAGWEVYTNLSQNYRGINFNDMRVLNNNLRVDRNLKDESGFNADLGWRGSFGDGQLDFDFSLFYLAYNDRIDAVSREDTTLFNEYRYRTNVSDSRHLGLESFAEWNVLRTLGMKDHSWRASLLGNAAWIDARYHNSREPAVEGKRVAQVPPLLLKTGASFGFKKLQTSFLYSYTAKHYTDATNAESTSEGVVGAIPAYWVMDLSMKYKWRLFLLEGGVNNLTDNIYFTRRADGYPGPGIIPANPSTYYLTLGLQWSPF